MTTWFAPASESEHRLACAGYDKPDYCIYCRQPFMEHSNGECPDDDPESAVATAMGAGRYVGSPAWSEDREELSRLERQAVAAHNACHDWLIAQGCEFVGSAPPHLTNALHEAEARVAEHKRRMAALRFDDPDAA